MPSPTDTEGLAAVKEFISLTDANPLALKLLVHAFCNNTCTPQQFITVILSGQELEFDNEWLKKASSGSFLDETQREIEELKLSQTLLPFWDLIPVEQLNSCSGYQDTYFKRLHHRSEEDELDNIRIFLPDEIEEWLYWAERESPEAENRRIEDFVRHRENLF